MIDLQQEIQTLKAFEQWLERQESDRIVGAARSDCNCPLSNFLFEEAGRTIVVDRNGAAVDGCRLFSSRLSYEFVRQIDDGRRNGQPVSTPG